jgi:hypothetical protein
MITCQEKFLAEGSRQQSEPFCHNLQRIAMAEAVGKRGKERYSAKIGNPGSARAIVHFLSFPERRRMAEWKREKCGTGKEGRCKPKKCQARGATGTMAKIEPTGGACCCGKAKGREGRLLLAVSGETSPAPVGGRINSPEAAGNSGWEKADDHE